MCSKVAVLLSFFCMLMVLADAVPVAPKDLAESDLKTSESHSFGYGYPGYYGGYHGYGHYGYYPHYGHNYGYYSHYPYYGLGYGYWW